MKLDENDYVIWGNLGDARRFSKEYPAALYISNYQSAIDRVKEALVVNPKDGLAYASLAYYYAILGEKENAVQALENALQIEPYELETWRKITMVYEILGNRDKALQFSRGFLENQGSLFYIVNEPDLKELQDDPQFRKICEDLGIR